MKKIILLTLVLLVGCKSEYKELPTEEEIVGVLEEFHLKDGTRCVTWKRGYAGGLSCDWNRNK
jgi:hypothetical protein